MFVSKSGEKIPVVNSIAPIKKGQGEIVGFVVSFRDVTTEREIDRAKTEFVSIASHQLRTPLTTINWYCEMILSKDSGKLTNKQERYVNEVYKANKRMVILMNALLNVSRLEKGTFMIEPKSEDVTNVIRSAVNEFKTQIADKKIKFQAKYDSSIPHISVDANLLSMIVQNLLSNSIKYTTAGGRVNLSTNKKDGSIIISVADNGIGIPKNQHDRIFTKLFRSDNAKRVDPDGTGLGLYIVKTILENTGGKITFESAEGKGSKFMISLPLSGMNKKTGTKQLN